MSRENERLAVIHGQDLVGLLSKEINDRLVFEYSQEWLDSLNTFAISLSLPLTNKPFVDERPGRFFANLLPEGRLRSLVARRLGLSEENDFALLKAVGGECAGALSVLPENQTETTQVQNKYRPLSKKELAKMAAAGDVLPTVTGKGKFRLSLAGAQDKLPVFVEDGKFYLPEGNSPSSHILKFPNRDYGHLPANEMVTTLLAKAAGLRNVELELEVLGDMFACLVTRYDRRRDENGDLVRIHQEDFCQAMGLSHRTKYEEEGGPSFEDCFGLASRVCTEPLPDLEQMLKWQAFNAVVGNADGHAKNLSLVLATGRSVKLAPFYDLVCTRAYRHLDRNLAMRVGGVADPGHVRGQDWIRMADEIGVGSKFVLQLVRSVAESTMEASKRVAGEIRSRYRDSPAVQMIVPIVAKHARRIIRQLGE